MVQKHLTKAYNNTSIKANNTLKLDTKQTLNKPSLQNHEFKSKTVDLKAIKMKKSRSTNKSNVNISLQTPSPNKSSPYNTTLYTSPNYMKSTSSSESRKSDTKTTISKLAKTSTNSSNLEKIRTLIKVPSFKHTRSTTRKKVVFNNLDVQRATCSSTLKDSKFPEYLKLSSGTTKGEGNSVSKVCPYTYCSLNGHSHASLPPLKRFLSSRRRIMKSLKSKPEVISPRKVKESKYFENEGEEDPDEDFFVEVFVSGQEFDTQASKNETDFSGMNFSSEDEDYGSIVVQKKLSFDSDEDSDDFLGANLDMDWEEGHSFDAYDVSMIYVERDYSKDNGNKMGFELNKSDSEKLEQFHDEILECLDFSDIDASSDSEPSRIGEKLAEDLVMFTENEITEHTYLPYEATEILKYKSAEEVIEVKDEELKNLEEKEADNNNGVSKRSAFSQEEFDSSTLVFEMNLSEIQDHSMTQKADESSTTRDINVISDNGESDSNPKHLEIRNKLKRSIHEGIKVEKEFNPRGPNFLPVEIEREPEKVDLRHREIDERRKADEWMLDYALQKTVNQLGPARKRKVALLVEAFESVLSIPKCQNHMRRYSSGFAHASIIQACS